MMSKDKHLGTGEYDPQKYWEARVKTSQGNIYQAVCAFGLSDAENAAMEKIQATIFTSMVKSINLKAAKVMELGCGVGRWAPFILKCGASYVGVDISESMLEMAREKVPNGKFYKINSSKLPFQNDEFDMVFSVTVLHHNPYEQQRKIIDEMIRVTKPQGIILLMEGIAAKRMQSSFNMFPRPVDDWIAEIERDGRSRLVKLRLARWWVLRDVTFKVLRSLGISKANREDMKALNSFLVREGSYVDRYLMWLLPKRFATNAAMLFIKEKSEGFQ